MKDKKKLVKWFSDFIPACAYSLTAILLGLRKGEAGRANALKPKSPFAAQIEFWFVISSAFHEVYEEIGPEIQIFLIATLTAVIKETIKAVLKGGK